VGNKLCGLVEPALRKVIGPDGDLNAAKERLKARLRTIKQQTPQRDDANVAA
jgi:hypothetical protein